MRQRAVSLVAAIRAVGGAAGLALALAAIGAPLGAAPAPRLGVRLVHGGGLPDDARSTLVAEVERLWRRAGVVIDWQETADPPADVRVLVVSQGVAGTAVHHTWPVAELLAGSASTAPVAVASLQAAWRVVDVAGPAGEPAALRHQRLGRVLGRAVAHELGHVLIGRHHADRGLMRARIDAAAFADLRDGGFEIGPADAVVAVAHVARRPAALAARAVPR